MDVCLYIYIYTNIFENVISDEGLFLKKESAIQNHSMNKGKKTETSPAIHLTVLKSS